MEQHIEQPIVETPAPITTVDQAVAAKDQAAFRELRRAERTGKTPIIDEPIAPVETATPEQEADTGKPDTEISDAARTLRKNRAEERKAKIQAEINELTKAKHRELEELNRLRSDRERLAQPPQQSAAKAAPVVSDKPKLTDFTAQIGSAEIPDYETAQELYQDARDGWNRARWETEQRAQSAARDHLTVAQAAQQRIDTFKQQHPDFDTVVMHPEVVASELMVDALNRSEVGPAIAYHLGQHPEESRRLASLPPARLFMELGKLEAKFVDSPAAPLASAPVITKAVTPTTLGKRSADPADAIEAAVASGDMSRFKALRQAERAARFGR